eukprot:758160-Hanusia_phi.AAC.1
MAEAVSASEPPGPWPGGGACTNTWYESCLPGCQSSGGLPARVVRSHTQGIFSAELYDADLATSHDGKSLYVLGRDGSIWMVSAFEEGVAGEMIFQDPGFADTSPKNDPRCRIAVKAGDILISEIYNHGIWRLPLNSTTGKLIYDPKSLSKAYEIFLAGPHLAPGNADGTCDTAYFNYPTGMAVGA